MKREGRQHGMVRAYRILPASLDPRPPSSRILNELTTPPTAGNFTRVSSRPTNHSKFTGKFRNVRCRRDCRINPACKSKDKCKGSQKPSRASLRSSSAPEFKILGFPASDALNYLGDEEVDDDGGFGYGGDVEISEEACGFDADNSGINQSHSIVWETVEEAGGICNFEPNV